jgi:hypothetical protein
MSAIIVDISEFLANPVRTGIQRVVRQLISLWPEDTTFRFACYDPAIDGLYQPPARAVDAPSRRARIAAFRRHTSGRRSRP